VNRPAATAATATTPHIDEHAVTLLAGDRPAVVLAVATRRIAATLFRTDPPAAHELERAIDVVEDAIMAARAGSFDGRELVSAEPVVRLLARTAAARATFSRDTVEGWFQQLASASHGNPGALGDLPRDRVSAATLLIVREVMHHLGFDSLTLVERRGHRARQLPCSSFSR
jgi:hypothetical protein